MKITVLGGKGLLGSRLIPLLEANGHEILVASRSSDPPVELLHGHLS